VAYNCASFGRDGLCAVPSFCSSSKEQINSRTARKPSLPQKSFRILYSAFFFFAGYSWLRAVDTPAGLEFRAMGVPGSASEALSGLLCSAWVGISAGRAVETPAGFEFLAIGISGLAVSAPADELVTSGAIIPLSISERLIFCLLI
jgi:hypothetical protein